ncbi:MAG: methionine synthase [Candidatus Omnitrophota bacterium]
MRELRGLATGIGSLPHKDADEAIDLIFKYLPEIPFWPQLPKRNHREGMVAQYGENLPCMRFVSNSLIFDGSEKEKELEVFYEHIIAGDADYFKISPDFAAGLYRFYERLEKMDLSKIKYIKCHITGPFTFAAGLKDEKGVSLLYDPILLQAIIKGLGMKAFWQINLFRKFGKPIIMFVDEPYLSCFGSAYAAISREDVVGGLTETIETFKSDDVLVGAHCCGNTDWSMFTDVQGLEIINFDAFDFQDKFVLYAADLNKFLKRDGVICWGIVPTQSDSGYQTPEQLARKIEGGIETLAKKALDKNLLFSNLLISPACGLGSLETGAADKILQLLSQTALILRKNP